MTKHFGSPFKCEFMGLIKLQLANSVFGSAFIELILDKIDLVRIDLVRIDFEVN